MIVKYNSAVLHMLGALNRFGVATSVGVLVCICGGEVCVYVWERERERERGWEREKRMIHWGKGRGRFRNDDEKSIKNNKWETTGQITEVIRMWKKTVFVLSIHTREYSGRQTHGKHLNVLMLHCICCWPPLFYTTEGGCSLKVSEARLWAEGQRIELLWVQEGSESSLAPNN